MQHSGDCPQDAQLILFGEVHDMESLDQRVPLVLVRNTYDRVISISCVGKIFDLEVCQAGSFSASFPICSLQKLIEDVVVSLVGVRLHHS